MELIACPKILKPQVFPKPYKIKFRFICFWAACGPSLRLPAEVTKFIEVRRVILHSVPAAAYAQPKKDDKTKN